MNEKALLIVSFGTSYPEPLERNIAAAEREIAAAMPERRLFRAFTSGMILRKLAKRDGIGIDDVPAALERIAGAGYSDVVIQPTHVMNGEEYDKLCAQAEPWRARFSRFALGKPLLTAVQDYRDVTAALMQAVPAPAQDEAVVFMGHGTEHFANSAYVKLEYMLHDAGWKRAFVGTVEGYPTLHEVIRRLREQPGVGRVRLYPLMLVAGDHAVNDMAGEGPDSWRSRMEAAGYEVSCVLTGLGEYPGVRRIFAAHALEAEGRVKSEE